MAGRREETVENCLLERVHSWNLPEDISLNIFCRLPVKYLMRCKCVSKSWNSSISTPELIKMHLSHAPHCNNPDILVVTTKYEWDNIYLSTISLKWNMQLLENVGCDNQALKSIRMPEDDTALCVVGSCNGLVCFAQFGNKNDQDIFLHVYNPVTRETIKLPASSDGISFEGALALICFDYNPIEHKEATGMFAFGYSPILDEYKALGLVIYPKIGDSSSHYKVEAEVCTLGSGYWKRIEDVPFLPFGRHRNVYMNGALYWLATRVFDSSIIGIGSFDVGTEAFSFLPLPSQVVSVQENDSIDLDLGVLGSCIYVVNYTYSDRVEIWTMERCRAKESWTKRYVFLMSENVNSVPSLCLLKNGEILIHYNRNKLAFCDPKNGQIRSLDIHGLPEEIRTFVHTGTLISPVTGKAQNQGLISPFARC